MMIWHEWMGFIADIVGIGTFGVTLAVLFIVRRRKSRERKPTENDAVMIINVNKYQKPIITSVREFIKKDAELSKVFSYADGNDNQFEFSCTHLGKEIGEKDLDRIADELKRIQGKVYEAGYACIHLFLNCPEEVAVIAGNILSAGKPVFFYHWNDDEGTYKKWGKMTRVADFIPTELTR